MKYTYLLCYLVLIVFIFFGLPSTVLFAKSGFLKYIPFFFLFIPSPYLLFVSLIRFKIKKRICVNIALGSIFILGPCFGIWTDFKTQQELNNNSQITTGIIYKKWFNKNHRSIEGEWLYQVKFKVDNINYITFSETDKLNKQKKGDSVNVKYSKTNPEINEIINSI